MKWVNIHILASKFAVLFLLLVLLGNMPFVVSDPIDTPDTSGTHVLTWDLSDQADYFTDNVMVESGHASLLAYESIWNQSTIMDFGNATKANNVNVSAGGVKLILDRGLQMLANGDFVEGSGSAADNWAGEISGSASAHQYGRYTSGGYDDGGYCWRNWFVDADNTKGFDLNVWVNQTINLTLIPLDINISAFHNFSNNGFELSPGVLAEIHITDLNMTYTYNLTSSGWVNSTYSGYRSLGSTFNVFNHTGLYNISLFTRVDTTANVSHKDNPKGIENFWDRASLEYSAYRPAGNFTSQVFDTGSHAVWKNIDWAETLPPGTDIEVFVRTGNSSVPTDSIWSPWSAPLTNASGSDIDCPVGRYIQYRVEFSTSSVDITPVLEYVCITYEKYYLAGSVATVSYSPEGITSWGFFHHQEALHGQSISYQYSVNSGNSWISMPSDGDLRALDPMSHIRIRALLNTMDSVITPSVVSIKITYVAVEPSLTLEPIWNLPGVGSGETIRLFIHFNNSADSISSTAWLNVYLDKDLDYLANNSRTISGFQNYIPDDNPNIRKYVFSNIPAGSNTMWIDAIMHSNIDDGTIIQTTVTLDYLDPIGNRVESELKHASIRANSPFVTAEIITSNDSVDVGESINYRVLVNNTGHGSAPLVWLNGSVDDRFQIPDLGSQNITILVNGLEGQTSRSLAFNVTLKGNVAQDSIIPMDLDIQYSDISGFIRQASTNEMMIMASLRSKMSISLDTQTNQVNSNALLVVTVHYDNDGYGSADLVYINMSLPTGLEMNSSSIEYRSFGGYYAWELEDVGPGSHSFTITFRTDKMGQNIFFSDLQAYMLVTDPVEGQSELESSNMLSIEIVRIYTFWEQIYWPWSGIAMALAGFFIISGLWNYLKPEPPTIDDVFVIYRDGRLIAHRKSGSGLRADIDGDLVSAMLTVVQDFISDSLSKDRTDRVKKLEFGDKELYVERSDNINLAIIYSGSMNKKLETQIINLTHSIETEHPFLPAWDGRMSELDDINPQLDALIGEWQHLNDKSDGNSE